MLSERRIWQLSEQALRPFEDLRGNRALLQAIDGVIRIALAEAVAQEAKVVEVKTVSGDGGDGQTDRASGD